jgi:hypothetical protein
MGLDLKMLNADTELLIWWKVRVSVPQDGGTVRQDSFKAQFKIMGDARFAEVAKDATPAEMLREVVVGWSDLTANGEPVPFSEDMRDRITDLPFMRSALFDAFLEARVGQRPKN